MNDFKPLSDLVFNVTDKVVGKKDSAKPYVGLEHMPSGGSSLLGFGRASDSISTNNVFRPGDTLFGKLRSQLRKSVQVSFDGYCSTDILVLRASTGENEDFTAKIIQSEGVFAQAIRTEEGTKMPRTSWGAIKDVPVLSPPLPQQRKIARILTTVDNLIEKTEALIAKYQAIKQGMMHDLFTRGVDKHGHLRPPYEEAPELYKQSELGWIPKDWDFRLWKEFVTKWAYGPRFSAKNYSEFGNAGTIRGTDFTNDGSIHYLQVPLAQLPQRMVACHELKQGDLVIVTTADCGVAAVFDEQECPFIASAYAVAYRLNDSVNPKFLKRSRDRSCSIQKSGNRERNSTSFNEFSTISIPF